jgi:hypothetical protein
MRGFYGCENAKLFGRFWAYQRRDIPVGNKIQTTIQRPVTLKIIE